MQAGGAFNIVHYIIKAIKGRYHTITTKEIAELAGQLIKLIKYPPSLELHHIWRRVI